MTVPGCVESTDHWKPSTIASESNAWSLVSQIAMRSLMISPGVTLPLVVSQPVAPPLRLLESQLNDAGSSKPVINRSSVLMHVEIEPAVPEQPVAPFTHCVNRPVLPNARLTPTG